jgi:hypothetical protein
MIPYTSSSAKLRLFVTANTALCLRVRILIIVNNDGG